MFLSYAHEDRERVKAIEGELNARGIQTWLDADDLRGGQKWRTEIEQAIAEAGVFVPVLSRNTSDAGKYVWLEWRRAAESAGLSIVPLAIDDAALPAFFREEEHVLRDPADRQRFVERVRELSQGEA